MNFLFGPSEQFMNIVDSPHELSPHKFSPNSYNKEDKQYWLQFSFFKQKKNIIFWDSPEDLFEKIINTNFNEVSNKMKMRFIDRLN